MVGVRVRAHAFGGGGVRTYIELKNCAAVAETIAVMTSLLVDIQYLCKSAWFKY